MRFSLKEFLLIATVACLGVPAFCFATPVVKSLVLMATAAVVLRAAIRAMIEREAPQAAAIGFLLPAVVYSVLVVSSVSSGQFGRQYHELDPYTGKLPTTQLLTKPMEILWAQRSHWLDPQGKPSKSPPASNAANFGGGGLAVALTGVGWRHVENPPRGEAMAIGHCLWTLLLGYLGSKYAAHVYARRVQR